MFLFLIVSIDTQNFRYIFRNISIKYGVSFVLSIQYILGKE
jgi:hypothetical protein